MKNPLKQSLNQALINGLPQSKGSIQAQSVRPQHTPGLELNDHVITQKGKIAIIAGLGSCVGEIRIKYSDLFNNQYEDTTEDKLIKLDVRKAIVAPELLEALKSADHFLKISPSTPEQYRKLMKVIQEAIKKAEQ